MKQFIFFICAFVLIIGTMIYGIVINNQNQINTDLTMQNNVLISQINNTMDRYNKLQEDYNLLYQTHENTLKQLDFERRQFAYDRQRFTEQVQALQEQIFELKVNELENEQRIAELELEVAELEQQIADIDAQVLALETENAQLLTSVSNYETQIFNLNTQIDEMVADLNAKNELWQKLMNGTITEITAEDLQGVTEIRPYAFYNCTKLKSVEIPYNITEIGTCAFQGTGITSLFIPNSVVFKSLSERCQFRSCASLKTVEFENGITQTADFMFKGCRSLTNVKLPDTLTFISNETFYDCSNLETIEIPQTVTTIWHDVFNGCTKLKNITLPASLTELGDRVFQRCENLTQLIVPNSLTTISGSSIFWYCDNLETIDLGKNWPHFSSPDFVGCSKLKTVILRHEIIPEYGCSSSSPYFPHPLIENFKCYVLDELVDGYKIAEGWSQYAEYFAPLSEYEALQNQEAA